MEITLREVAEAVKGKLIGCPEQKISGLASLQDAIDGDLSFVVSSKYYKLVDDSKASALLLEEGLPLLESGKPCIICKNAYLAFADMINLFYPQEKIQPSIHPTAVISKESRIGKNCFIGPYAVIEAGAEIGPGCILEAQVYIGSGVTIGERTRIYPRVTILKNVKIGSQVILHSGTVIGSDGFGYTRFQETHLKIPHVGGVVIEDNVEIGANSTVDRGTVGNTVIGAGSKLDNLIQIAHNVKVGRNCLIVAQSGIAGSATLENNVTMAAQSGVVGHLTVGANSVLAARTVVTHCLPPGSFVSGFPARPHQEETKIKAALKRLPELLKRIARLEKIFSEKKED